MAWKAAAATASALQGMFVGKLRLESIFTAASSFVSLVSIDLGMARMEVKRERQKGNIIKDPLPFTFTTHIRLQQTESKRRLSKRERKREGDF